MSRIARSIPYAAGATCFLAAIFLRQSLVAHQRADLQRVVGMMTAGSLAELGTFTQSMTRALDHIAGEWEAAGRLPAAQWRHQCRLVLERLGRPRAVEWLDDDGNIVDVVVPEPERRGGAREPSPPLDAEARAALAGARARRAAAATPAFASDADAQRWSFRLVVPLFRDGRADGFVSALFSVDDVVDDLLATLIHDYVVTIDEDGRQIYGPRDPDLLAPCPACDPYAFDLPGGRRWQLEVRPSPEVRTAIASGLPQIILAAGALIAALLTAMLQALARQRRGARALALTNRSLQGEVHSRRIAEQELRVLAAELEQRVRERTAELASSNAALSGENALRRHAQTTLEAANGNLRHFASFVSHELRQPLAAMALWVDLLENDPDATLGERGRGYLRQLGAALERMTGFLEAQLRLARVTYTQPNMEEDVDVGALAREVAGDGALGLRNAGAAVEIGEVPTLRADRGQMRQLLRNLIENALKYRRADTPLRVRIEGRRLEREGVRRCEIRCSDNGQGFAASDAEKIFDLFAQLPGRKSTDAGSGVGLAICRRIVEHHGGTIRAEGRPGEGATFIIELPASRCGSRGGDAAPAAACI